MIKLLGVRIQRGAIGERLAACCCSQLLSIQRGGGGSWGAVRDKSKALLNLALTQN